MKTIIFGGTTEGREQAARKAQLVTSARWMKRP